MIIFQVREKSGKFGFSQGNWQNIGKRSGKSQGISKLRCPYGSLNFQKLINLLNIVFIVLLNDI